MASSLAHPRTGSSPGPHRRGLFLLLLPAVLSALASGMRTASGSSGAAPATPRPSARTVGDLQTVYDWRSENCAQRHPPDRERCAFSFKCKNMTAQNTGLCCAWGTQSRAEAGGGTTRGPTRAEEYHWCHPRAPPDAFGCTRPCRSPIVDWRSTRADDVGEQLQG